MSRSTRTSSAAAVVFSTGSIGSDFGQGIERSAAMAISTDFGGTVTADESTFTAATGVGGKLSVTGEGGGLLDAELSVLEATAVAGSVVRDGAGSTSSDALVSELLKMALLGAV
jgi:hypothetical protein